MNRERDEDRDDIQKWKAKMGRDSVGYEATEREGEKNKRLEEGERDG